jgi:hypothetical protein
MRKLIPTLLLSMISVFISNYVYAADEDPSGWVFAQNGGRGPKPFITYIRKEEYFVCAGKTPHGFQAGHLKDKESVCYVPWGESSLRFSSYYVLQGDFGDQIGQKMEEVAAFQVIQLDPENGKPTAICIAPNGLPGKIVNIQFRKDSGLDGVCYTSENGRNYIHNKFNVLIETTPIAIDSNGHIQTLPSRFQTLPSR